MDLDLPYGPWKPVVTATWDGYPIALYLNAERVLMLIYFEKRGGDVANALVCLKKAFLTDADLSKAPSKQPREITIIDKRTPEGASKVLMLGSTPAYIKYTHDELVEAMGKQFRELEALTRFAGEFASAYGGSCRDLGAVTEEEAQAVLGDPFSYFAVFNPNALAQKQKEDITVMLGLDSTGKPAEIPLAALNATEVVGGSTTQRLNAVRILLEGALLNAVPVVIFDSTGAFKGLSEANDDTRDFTKNRMTAMPLGFPVSEYKLANGTYIDLGLITPELFLEAFGISGTDVGKATLKAWAAEPLEKHRLSDLEASVANLAETPEVTRYTIAKTQRLLKVISKKHPALFNRNAASDLMAPWHEGIGRVFHVDLSGQPDNVNHLIVYSVVNSTPAQKGKKLRMVVAFDTDASKVYLDVLKALDQMRKNGVGFVLHSEHDLDSQLSTPPECKVEIVAGETVSTLKGSKPVRFDLRPPYTKPYDEGLEGTKKAAK